MARFFLNIRHISTEHWLKGVGCVLAAGSFTFAGLMMWHDRGPPGVEGILPQEVRLPWKKGISMAKDLSIDPIVTGTTEKASKKSLAFSDAHSGGDLKKIGLTPPEDPSEDDNAEESDEGLSTAEVQDKTRAIRSINKEYKVRAATRQSALIEGSQGLREVRVGTAVPNFGTVTAIEAQGGQWIVLTSQGAIE